MVIQVLVTNDSRLVVPKCHGTLVHEVPPPDADDEASVSGVDEVDCGFVRVSTLRGSTVEVSLAPSLAS